MGGLKNNYNQLQSLHNTGAKVQSSSLIHPSVKESVKNKLLSVDLSVKSLEEASMYSHQKLLSSIQEENNDRKALELAESYVKSTEKVSVHFKLFSFFLFL